MQVRRNAAGQENAKGKLLETYNSITINVRVDQILLPGHTTRKVRPNQVKVIRSLVDNHGLFPNSGNISVALMPSVQKTTDPGFEIGRDAAVDAITYDSNTRKLLAFFVIDGQIARYAFGQWLRKLWMLETPKLLLCAFTFV